MAQIDLKNATIRIKDGYSATAAINHVNGYVIGDTTIVVDGVTGIVPTGATFLVTGDATVYTVSSHTETLGNTTSVVFTPALVADAADNAVVTFKQLGAVNNGPGYATTTTTMVVDGITGIISNGMTFILAAHATVYTVSGHSETLGNTTSITFTPGLADAAVNDDVLTFSRTGAINFAFAYEIGDTTIVIDTFTGSIEDGQQFTIAGDSTTYTVSSASDTLGNTTSLTFTPALVVAPANNAVITLGPHRLEVTIGEGNLTYDEKRNVTYTLDRGSLDTVKLGDEVPMDVKIDFTWEFLKADTGEPPTVEDALKQRGEASDWISTSSDTCEPYAVDIEVEYIPPCSGIKTEIILLNDFRYEQLSHDLKQGTVSVTGKCNSTEATVTRVTAA